MHLVKEERKTFKADRKSNTIISESNDKNKSLSGSLVGAFEKKKSILVQLVPKYSRIHGKFMTRDTNMQRFFFPGF